MTNIKKEVWCFGENKTIGDLVISDSITKLTGRFLLKNFQPANESYRQNTIPKSGELWKCPRCGFGLYISGTFRSEKDEHDADIAIIVNNTKIGVRK